MARRKQNLQRHAQGGRFEGLDLSIGAIAANKDRAADQLKFLRAQQVDDEQKGRNQIAGIEDAFITEQRQQEGQKRIDDQIANLGIEAVRTNKKRAFDNAQQDVQNIRAQYEEFSKFSTAARKGIVQIDKHYTELRETADLIAGFGIQDPEELKSDLEAEETLSLYSGSNRRQVALMLAAGLDPRLVTETVRQDKYPKFKLIKENVEIKSAEFANWFDEQLTKHGLVDPGEVSRASGSLFYQYLNENGLVNEKGQIINKKILRPLFQKMQTAYTTKLQGLAKTQMRQELENNFQQNEKVWRANPANTAYTRDAIEALSNTYNAQTGRAYGAQAVPHFLETQLSDVSQITDERLEEFLDSPVPEEINGRKFAQFEGQTWRDRYGGSDLLDGLMKKRAEDLRADDNAQNAIETKRKKELLDKALTWAVDGSWDGSRESLTKVSRELQKLGVDTTKLDLYAFESNESKNEDYWRQELNRLGNTLTVQDLNNPSIPVIVRTEFKDKAITLEQQLSAVGINMETNKKYWEGVVLGKLKANSLDARAHYSSGPAVDRAVFKFMNRFNELSKTNSPIGAYNAALNEVTTAVETDKTGDFITAEDDSGNLYYPKFSGGHPTAPNIDITNPTESFDKVHANPGILQTELVVSRPALQNLVNQIRVGGSVFVPPVFKDLAGSPGWQGGTLSEMVNHQLELFDKASGGKYPERLNPLITERLATEAQTEATKQLINTIRSYDDLIKASVVVEAEKGTISPKTLMNSNVQKTVIEEGEEFDLGGAYQIPGLEPLIGNDDQDTIPNFDFTGTLPTNIPLIHEEIGIDGTFTFADADDGNFVRIKGG